jgi:hypothetical protein
VKFTISGIAAVVTVETAVDNKTFVGGGGDEEGCDDEDCDVGGCGDVGGGDDEDCDVGGCGDVGGCDEEGGSDVGGGDDDIFIRIYKYMNKYRV